MEKNQNGTTGARTKVPQVIGARFYHCGGYTSVYINQTINIYGKHVPEANFIFKLTPSLNLCISFNSQQKKSQNAKQCKKNQKGTNGARTQVPQVTGTRFYYWGGYTSVYINQSINIHIYGLNFIFNLTPSQSLCNSFKSQQE